MEIRISEHFSYRKLFRFVLPTIFMMVFSSVYGVIDGFFISNFVGKTPFAAINLIMPFIMILGGMGFMLGTGGTALVLKTAGENDKEKSNRYFSMIILFAVLFGLCLTVLGMAIVRPVARLFGATEDMLEYCVLYGRIVIGFTTFFMLQNIFQSFLAAAEKPKLGFLVTLIAGALMRRSTRCLLQDFIGALQTRRLQRGSDKCSAGLFPSFILPVRTEACCA